jgi:hypothetical protein
MPKPADACPYPRPFPPGFDECDTFDAQMWVPLDSHFQPLRATRTCRHLSVGSSGEAFYARCALGDAAARARLAAGASSRPA